MTLSCLFPCRNTWACRFEPVPVRKAFETRSKGVRKPFGNRSKGDFKLSSRTRITRSIACLVACKAGTPQEEAGGIKLDQRQRWRKPFEAFVGVRGRSAPTFGVLLRQKAWGNEIPGDFHLPLEFLEHTCSRYMTYYA